MTQRPYVAQDEDGGWYGDCCGVMQDPAKYRTEAEALRWCLDRLWRRMLESPERHYRGDRLVAIYLREDDGQ